VHIGAQSAYADLRSLFRPSPISGVCDGAVSTGLGFEINPVGSFGGKSGVRVAIRPMISVPLLPNRPFPLSKIEILKPIRRSD
jgi:hypothetical protein